MRILQTVGIGVLAAVALLMIASVFIPSEVHVERSVIVKAPKELIFQQVNTLQNWQKWSPFTAADAGARLEYQGPEGGEGASYTWVSVKNGVGEGQLTITKSVPFELIETRMDFYNNRMALGFHKFEELPNGVRLTWRIQTDVGKSPYNKYRGLFMDNMLGPQLAAGLNKIKELTE